MKWHSASMCKNCWREKYGNAYPVHLLGNWKETCCYCGAENEDGIYVRDNAETIGCHHHQENNADG